LSVSFGAAATAVLAVLCRHPGLYAGLDTVWAGGTLAILPRLWVMQANRYSILAPSNPRRSSFRRPYGPLIWPKTGSTIVPRPPRPDDLRHNSGPNLASTTFLGFLSGAIPLRGKNSEVYLLPSATHLRLCRIEVTATQFSVVAKPSPISGSHDPCGSPNSGRSASIPHSHIPPQPHKTPRNISVKTLDNLEHFLLY
jgi:hypothetical protein